MRNHCAEMKIGIQKRKEMVWLYVKTALEKENEPCARSCLRDEVSFLIYKIECRMESY